MNEWEWITHLRKKVRAPENVIGVGDDAAVLPGGMVVTTDSFVEEIHFRREWAPWDSIGRKMAEASISDIAAMGGTPRWMLANLSTSDPSIAGPLLEGLLAAGTPLIGGDTTGGATTTVSITVIGEAPRPVLRSGAKPGDSVYVSGALGGSVAGFQSLKGGLGNGDAEIRFLEPRARIDIAPLWGKYATSMIDISDGLSSELNHLARESGVRIEIDLSLIPLFPGVNAELALHSGEEFELLATAPDSLPGGYRIGSVLAGSGVTADGKVLEPKGYTHWK